MNAFLDNPEQWEIFKEQRPATAVDEIVRWATPVNSFQRTALVDTEIRGVKIAKGDRVGMFYGSANYDEEVFDKPFEFNVLRDPTRTSASVATARTSAWAPTSRAHGDRPDVQRDRRHHPRHHQAGSAAPPAPRLDQRPQELQVDYGTGK